MGLEIEAAADLVTAGLVAKEVEGHAGEAGAHAHAGPCANCGTPVSGNFCGHCGQKGHLHKSVLHLGEELIHGLLHFDTKGWRTLPLLIARPGQLTRRYIDGQRTRFVSPLALFLFMMFFMFFVFSLTMGTSSKQDVVTVGKDGKVAFEEKMAEKIANQKELIAEAEKDLKEADADEMASAKRRLEKAQRELDGLNTALAAGKVAMSDSAKSKATGKKAEKTQEAENSPGVLHEIAKDIEITADADKAAGKESKFSDIPWINKAVKHAVDNPELAKYKLKNAAYKYSFLLVPISMPFLWLIFFWRRGITMYDHAVFSLYSLSFMSLLFTVVATLGYFNFGGWAASLFAFVPPVHMFLQLRGTYGLSRFGAFWRTCFMLIVAFIVLTLYALAVLALTAA